MRLLGKSNPGSFTTHCARSRLMRRSWPELLWHGALLWSCRQIGRGPVLALLGENVGLRICAVERFLCVARSGALASTAPCQVHGRRQYAETIRPSAATRRCLLPAMARACLDVSLCRDTRSVRESLKCIYDRAIKRLIQLPSTLIHGEFFASNILVQETRAGWPSVLSTGKWRP